MVLMVIWARKIQKGSKYRDLCQKTVCQMTVCQKAYCQITVCQNAGKPNKCHNQKEHHKIDLILHKSQNRYWFHLYRCRRAMQTTKNHLKCPVLYRSCNNKLAFFLEIILLFSILVQYPEKAKIYNRYCHEIANNCSKCDLHTYFQNKLFQWQCGPLFLFWRRVKDDVTLGYLKTCRS